MNSARISIAPALRATCLCVPLLLFGSVRANAFHCEPDGTMHVVVALAPPAGATIAGVVVDLAYPERAVDIPASGDAAAVKARITGTPDGFLGNPNDLDDALVVALAGTSGLPRGPIFTVEFDRCKNAPTPVAKEFRCKVTQASTQRGVLVDGTTCSATIVGDHPAKRGTKRKEGTV